MADVTLTTNYRYSVHDPECLISHRTDPSVVYFVYIDRSDFDLKYRKSTDGGASWSAATTIRTGSVASVSVWADWWTPGDTGTTIHTLCVDDGVDDVFYRPLDTASDTLGTESTVYAGTTLSNTSVSITKTRGGNLLAAWETNERAAYKSTDGGVNWSSIASPMEADNNDQIDLYPANLADNQDAWAIYFDNSDHEFSLKTYDDSANSWSEASIVTGITYDFFLRPHMGAVRHSDGHLLFVTSIQSDVATNDLLTFDIGDASSITAKTNVITDADDWGAARVFIDQRNNDVYVSHAGKSDGSETWASSVKIYSHKSSDGMASWDTDTARQEAAATNVAYLFSPPMGARFILARMRDDFIATYTVYTSNVLSIAMPPLEMLAPLVMAPPIGSEVII